MNKNLNERLSSKILDAISSEIGKSGTQEKLKCMIEPFSLYVLRTIQPYAFTMVALLTVLVVSQLFLLYKMLLLMNHLKTV